jgi:hypothetical protein
MNRDSICWRGEEIKYTNEKELSSLIYLLAIEVGGQACVMAKCRSAVACSKGMVSGGVADETSRV